MSCLFCSITEGKIPAKVVYEDDYVLAFEDIDKKAPVHVLIIPKKHMANVLELEECEIMAAMYNAVRVIADQLSVKQSGFRLVMNTGEDGGQTVEHLHMHMLAGRALAWPPG